MLTFTIINGLSEDLKSYQVLEAKIIYILSIFMLSKALDQFYMVRLLLSNSMNFELQNIVCLN